MKNGLAVARRVRSPLTPARQRAALVVLALVVLLSAPGAVFASAIDGACCLPSGACTVVIGSSCEAAGGEYFGDGTSCSVVNCAAPVAAPLLSVAGLIAAASGALGVSAMHFLRRRRR